jgi:hypothetical protein
MQPLELAVLRASEDSDDAIKIMADVRVYFQGTVCDLVYLVMAQKGFRG